VVKPTVRKEKSVKEVKVPIVRSASQLNYGITPIIMIIGKLARIKDN
jgi:hypothetical protein